MNESGCFQCSSLACLQCEAVWSSSRSHELLRGVGAAAATAGVAAAAQHSSQVGSSSCNTVAGPPRQPAAVAAAAAASCVWLQPLCGHAMGSTTQPRPPCSGCLVVAWRKPHCRGLVPLAVKVQHLSRLGPVRCVPCRCACTVSLRMWCTHAAAGGFLVCMRAQAVGSGTPTVCMCGSIQHQVEQLGVFRSSWVLQSVRGLCVWHVRGVRAEGGAWTACRVGVCA